MAWLLTAIFIVFFVVISIYLFGVSFDKNDVDAINIQSMFSSPSEDEFFSFATSIVYNEENRVRSSISFETIGDFLFIADVILTLVGIHLMLKTKAVKFIEKFKKTGAVAWAVLMIFFSGLFLFIGKGIDHVEDPDAIWEAIACDWLSLILAIIGFLAGLVGMLKEKFGSPKFVVTTVAAVVAGMGILYSAESLARNYNTKDKYWEEGKLSESFIARHWREYHNETKKKD